jgi:hypothetical protein
MSLQMHDPQTPQQPLQAITSPVIYVTEPIRWEYKQLVRELGQEGLLDEEALNRLGEEGWELAAALIHDGQATYIFKRVVS